MGLRSLIALTCAATGQAYLLQGLVSSRPSSLVSTVCPQLVRTASCQMNMGERFARLVKSNVNQALNSMEDPEKVLTQAVEDMQKDLIKVRQAYAEVSASTKRMGEQCRVAESEADKWFSRAQLALERGEDDLAREALTRKQQQTEMADSLKEQIEAQSGSIQSLFDSMKDLEAKMAEAKAKKDQIIARARTAKASTKVNDMLAGVGSSSSVAAFERMKDKVEQMEAEADVSKTLAASSGSSSTGGSLEASFKALESGSSVDDELAAMKKALPGSVDSELEEMKRLMGNKGGDDKK
jgi:phage shock protein A